AGGRGPSFPAAALAAPALALIGALAVACFVKGYGAVFLGTARSTHGLHAHESGSSMIGPMAGVGGCCLVIRLAPGLVAPLLGRAVFAWDPARPDAGADLAVRVPLDWLSGMGLALLAALLLGGLLLRRRVADLGTAEGPTWGCGYLAPTPRMQYTSSS